jgi:hypothetical protein
VCRVYDRFLKRWLFADRSSESVAACAWRVDCGTVKINSSRGTREDFVFENGDALEHGPKGAGELSRRHHSLTANFLMSICHT